MRTRERRRENDLGNVLRSDVKKTVDGHCSFSIIILLITATRFRVNKSDFHEFVVSYSRIILYTYYVGNKITVTHVTYATS